MKHRYTTLLRFTDCGAACSRTWSGRPRRSTPARPDKLHAHMSNLGAYTVAQCLSTCRYTPKLLSGSTWRVRAVHIYIHICTHVNCLDERGITSATGNWSTRLSSTLQRVGSQGDPARHNSNTSNSHSRTREWRQAHDMHLRTHLTTQPSARMFACSGDATHICVGMCPNACSTTCLYTRPRESLHVCRDAVLYRQEYWQAGLLCPDRCMHTCLQACLHT